MVNNDYYGGNAEVEVELTQAQYAKRAATNKKLLDTLDKYFYALEDGSANSIKPNPIYKWRFFVNLDLYKMRTFIENLDEYMGASPQKSWAESDQKVSYDSGPDLHRLSDNAVFALFQELDLILAEEKESK